MRKMRPEWSVFVFFSATPHIQRLMTVMIRRHETLFPLCNDVPPSPPSNKAENQKNSPRNLVGWGSTEVAQYPNIYFPPSLNECRVWMQVKAWAVIKAKSNTWPIPRTETKEILNSLWHNSTPPTHNTSCKLFLFGSNTHWVKKYSKYKVRK